MRAALLALLVALPAWAEGVVVQVHDGYVRQLDGVTLQVRGGAWLDGPTFLAKGQELEKLRAENERLKAAPVATPTAVVVALAIGITVGLGGAAALAVAVK